MTTPSPKAKVLVVDDSEDVRLLIASALQQQFEVLVAATGQQATHLAHSGQPALVLCDVTMPGLDGAGVLRNLKADDTTAHIPVVMMSGFNDHNTESTLRSLGAAGFLPKPFRLEELMSFVEQMISQHAACH